MSSTAPHLLLFDIDGTLLRRASSEHAAALHEAIQTVYGVDTATIGRDSTQGRIEAAGRTDLEIARQLLLRANVSAVRIDDRLGQLREVAGEAYARHVPDDLSATVSEGMVALLERLHARDDVLLSLVTGNLESIARLKLHAAGIGQFFERGQGGFGSDSEDRTDLPPIARLRAGTRDEPHPRERTIVIGDTPRDIACARADELRVIAITLGPHEAHEVADADVVVANVPALGAELDKLLV
ncbi:MAG: family hydrolase [Solirubrobacterales bacterium]|nr:family hydrolase [Solirubrobacterales bacterium]